MRGSLRLVVLGLVGLAVISGCKKSEPVFVDVVEETIILVDSRSADDELARIESAVMASAVNAPAPVAVFLSAGGTTTAPITTFSLQGASTASAPATLKFTPSTPSYSFAPSTAATPAPISFSFAPSTAATSAAPIRIDVTNKKPVSKPAESKPMGRAIPKNGAMPTNFFFSVR